MKYKAIIFDMDGTIIDSNHIWDQATKDLITSTGKDVTPKQRAEIETKLKGLALNASCKIIKEVMNLEHQIDELVERKQQRALELYQQQITFIDGFQNFHTKVLQQELHVGIATNSDDHTLNIAIQKMNLKTFFGEHIYNISHVNNVHKPAPDLYLHAAQKLGMSPDQCVAIEDSAHGIRAAVDAGMFCIGINTGKNKEALSDAHLIIDHYDEICLKRLLKTQG